MSTTYKLPEQLSRKVWLQACTLSCLLLIVGCTTYHTKSAKPTAGFGIVSFLRPGDTTREELRKEWGPPAEELLGGRIMFYRLAGRGDSLRFVAERGLWIDSRYNLVVVFNEGGILQKSAMVKVR